MTESNEKLYVYLFWIVLIGLFIYFIVKEPNRDGYYVGYIEGYQIDKDKDIVVYTSPRFNFKDIKGKNEAESKCYRNLKSKINSVSRKHSYSGSNIYVDPNPYFY